MRDPGDRRLRTPLVGHAVPSRGVPAGAPGRGADPAQLLPARQAARVLSCEGASAHYPAPSASAAYFGSTTPREGSDVWMDREIRRRVEEYRRDEAGPIENQLIDELVGGDLDRQEFLRRASIFGLGAGATGLLLQYMGQDVAFGAPTAVAQKRGGTLRVGAPTVGSSFEPRLLREFGSLALAGIVGEYLTFSNQALQVRPALATSWKPNAALTVWTFQIRRG